MWLTVFLLPWQHLTEFWLPQTELAGFLDRVVTDESFPSASNGITGYHGDIGYLQALAPMPVHPLPRMGPEMAEIKPALFCLLELLQQETTWVEEQVLEAPPRVLSVRASTSLLAVGTALAATAMVTMTEQMVEAFILTGIGLWERRVMERTRDEGLESLL